MRQDVGETREVSCLELLHCAKTHGDLQAWAAFQQCLEETVLTWFHDHPGGEAACRLRSERHFIALAFEQFWHIIVQGQVACETLSEVLVYLRASLNGAILQTLRLSSRPGAGDSSWPDVPTGCATSLGEPMAEEDDENSPEEGKLPRTREKNRR